MVAVVALPAVVADVAVAALPEMLFANVPVFATSWPDELVPTTAAEVGGAAPASFETPGFGKLPDRSPPAVPLGGSDVGSAACTKAVEAAWKVFVPSVAVGTVGSPERAGETDSATVDPVPVVVAATIWLLPFVPTTAAELGGAAPDNCVAFVAVAAVAALPVVLFEMVPVFATS